MEDTFINICNAWLQWSSNADKSEEGWESDYPKWEELIDLASQIMSLENISDEVMQSLELCWSLCEETEDLVDLSKDKLKQWRSNLHKLSKSANNKVRWQIYECLKWGDRVDEDILNNGLEDSDSYCRRRAILSLVHLRPATSMQIRSRFSNDPDKYIRDIVSKMTD